MPAEVLEAEFTDHMLILRLNRPEARNALNPDLMEALAGRFEEAESSPDVRCVVLTSNGDRAFCAGMDLRSFAEGLPSLPPRFLDFLAHGLQKPVIGAAPASAVAGGFELLLACDIVVAAEGATFALPEAKLALVAAGNGVYLGSRIPLAVALELTLTGDPISAERAFGLGLINRVVPASEVLAVALQMAGRIVRNGPLALKATREIVRMSAEDLPAARALNARWQPTIFGSDDAREGALAFVERREPSWVGK